MSYLEISRVGKGYGRGASRTEVLCGIDLKVEKGEFVAILGYSGSGKTTLMSLLAGLIMPDEGGVIFEGREVSGPGHERGLVFQNYSLLPWLTVEGNVRLAVDQLFPGESAAARARRVDEALAMVNLTPARRKYPKELSGGMRQRTSVARTLAMRPGLLLLDEPLSALDALTRSVIQDEILNIWDEMSQTIILITNDVDEAIYLADRIIPLSPGPGATFGPEERVDLPRPRDRAALNHDPAAKAVRQRILNFLLESKGSAKAGVPGAGVAAPQAKPIDWTRAKRSWNPFARPAPALAETES